VSLAAAGFVLEFRGGQRFEVFRVVGYMYVIGLWCGKWVLIFLEEVEVGVVCGNFWVMMG
jgi:hypothetical protein